MTVEGAGRGPRAADEAPLAAGLNKAPRLVDEGAARAKLARLNEASQAGAAGPTLAELLQSRAVEALLLGIADHSPYLWRLAIADAARLVRLLREGSRTRLDALLAEVHLSGEASEERVIMRALRQAKQEIALLTALADIGGVWDLGEITTALTRFADAAVSAALRFLLRQAVAGGRLTSTEAPVSGKGSGVVVLALGKHGAGELNYSSDIDIVVLFEPEAAELAAGLDPASFFVRLTKGLVRILQAQTEDGYVLRVDLRLRPDPASTAIAVSLRSALVYYETVGQNWERAALIKARSIAGDLALGRRFLAELTPFIWRKYFDYAAIADIHAMKRQIHAVRGHAQVTVAGHDVKLGRGGIREIEFFVQTQQLIFGGRRPQLRGARTLDMLAELYRDGWVTEEASRELAAAYVFLRTIEHRLQMVADEQTQRLPADARELCRFAAFCGFGSGEDFSEALRDHLRRVEFHYARLFEHAPGLATQAGSLVFTGVADDPETLETLRRLGFQRPGAAAETIRGWHFGRRAAVQSARAREVLTELVPALIEAFSHSGDPDAALATFDAALARMPAAVELFSLIKSNPVLRELFADILGAAPRLARIVAMRPHVLDAAIDPDLVSLTDVALEQRIVRACAHVASFEDFLDRARDLRHEEDFLIGVRLLSGAITPDAAAPSYSKLAEVLVRVTLGQVEIAFAREHGLVPGGRCALAALGKLGSREMSARSDLDLILVYDFDESRPMSDGARPLHAVQYYARLTQRLISALTVPTRRGTLYSVDLRLRPSGNKGPVAVQLARFEAYQREEAETWEHLALTRARVIAGEPSLAEAVSAVIRNVLARPRMRAAVAADVRNMRALIAKEKGDGGDFDLKIMAGGLIDIEFIAQFLVLIEAHAHPELIDPSTRTILGAARAAGIMPAEDLQALIDAHRLFSDMTEMVAACIDGDFDPESVPAGTLRRIAAALNAPGFRTIEREIAESRTRVRALFEATMQVQD